MTKMSNSGKKSGFTLIELLVVIAIILIGSSIIFIGGSSGDGAKLSSAQRIISGIAQGARGQALLKSVQTRLIIYSDVNSGDSVDPDKLLRFFGIVYKSEDALGNQGWLAATQGTYLPEGIYFDPDLSGLKSGSGWNNGDKIMTLDYPRKTLSLDGSGSQQFYYYEFNSNGTMATGSENSWLVFRSGTLRPNDSGTLAVNFPGEGEEGENLKSALIFRRVGSTTPVTDPSDIN